MNILIYTSIYPSPDIFGIPADTKVVHYFAREWANRGHNVRVIYLYLKPIKVLMDSIKKHRVLSVANYDYDGIAVDLIECQLFKPHARHPSKIQAIRIDSIIRKIKKDIGLEFDKVFVHFPTVFLGVNELFAGNTPTIATFHNSDIITLKNESKKCINYVDKFGAWGSRSNKIKDYLSTLTDKEIHQIYSGIDESLLISRDELNDKINTDTNKLIVVFAGNLIPLKNVDILIEAVKDISDECCIQLKIIGDGQEEDRLKKLAGDTSGIQFVGRLSREETIMQMRSANVFAMVSSPETFGLVYIEAMSQGCITIGSSGEGIDGVIVNGNNGFLIEPRNIDALRNILIHIQRMPLEDKARVINNAYETATNMTDKKMAKAYFDTI